jgi:hypothetical protein
MANNHIPGIGAMFGLASFNTPAGSGPHVELRVQHSEMKPHNVNIVSPVAAEDARMKVRATLRETVARSVKRKRKKAKSKMKSEAKQRSKYASR